MNYKSDNEMRDFQYYFPTRCYSMLESLHSYRDPDVFSGHLLECLLLLNDEDGKVLSKEDPTNCRFCW